MEQTPGASSTRGQTRPVALPAVLHLDSKRDTDASFRCGSGRPTSCQRLVAVAWAHFAKCTCVSPAIEVDSAADATPTRGAGRAVVRHGRVGSARRIRTRRSGSRCVLRSGSQQGGELVASYWRVIGKFARAPCVHGNAREPTARWRRCSPPARALRRNACRARARPGRAARRRRTRRRAIR